MHTDLAQKARDGRLAALAALREIQETESGQARRMRRSNKLRRKPAPFTHVSFRDTLMGFYGKNKLAA